MHGIIYRAFHYLAVAVMLMSAWDLGSGIRQGQCQCQGQFLDVIISAGIRLLLSTFAILMLTEGKAVR